MIGASDKREKTSKVYNGVVPSLGITRPTVQKKKKKKMQSHVASYTKEAIAK